MTRRPTVAAVLLAIVAGSAAASVADASTRTSDSRGSSSRCGKHADELSDISAMVPCNLGTVSAKGDPIDDARSFWFDDFDFVYSNAPAPALNWYGYWVPTPKSGPTGQDGCIFYEYASDMQVSGRWTERCAKPSMGAGAIIIICCIGFVVVFLSFYFVPAMVHNVQESLKRAANRRRRERQQMHNDSGAVLVPPGEAPPAYVGENGGRGRRNRSPAAAAAAAAAPMTSDDWRFASSSDAPHARVDAISGRRVWFTGPAEGAATTSVAEGASAASFAGATTAPGNSGPIGSVMTMYPIKKPVAGQEQQKAMQYFEVTVSQREQRSTTRVGLARKPHLANAHPGSVTGSIGLDLSTGTVYVNGRQHGKAEVPVSKPGSGDLGEDPLLPAVIVGVGVDATTDQAFFTVNGTLAWKERGKAEVVEQSTGGNRHAGRGRWNVFPTVGGSGKFVVDANFGDEDPFAWDHANTAAGGIIDVGLPSYVM